MPYKDKKQKEVMKIFGASSVKCKAQQQEKHDCDCGGCYSNANKAKHIKTKQHREHLGLPLIDKIPKIITYSQ
jgi:hypothetical protein